MPFQNVEVLRAAAAMASADGEIVELELVILKRLAGRAGVSEESLEVLMHRARHDDDFFVEETCAVLRNPEGAIEVLCRMAAVDGRISLDERVVLHYFAGRLGIDERRVREIVDRHAPAGPDE